tara:strand:- start:320 stop:1042 length:723 start_codon:yes stop_codon:yes gene_type:complete
MSFSTICPDIILVIREFIYSNQSLINLRTTSKYFKLFGDRYGNIKRMKYNINTNFFSFLTLYDKPEFLDSLEIENVQCPFNFIPANKVWPKEISFSYCILGAKRLSPPVSKTESFTYIGNFCRNPWISNILRIDWIKLPYLKKLIVRARKMDFEGLQNCKNLQKIIIELDEEQVLPEWIATLPDLQELITNCKTLRNLHFISEQLTVCLLSTKHQLTTMSRKLPERHLLDNSNINISVFM